MSKIDFYDYLGKNVVIIDVDGKEWHGLLDDVSNPLDEEDEIERVTLDTKRKYCRYIEFLVNEISSIKELN
nr:MAG TPA: hypothetical protein [Caudoviricetes sp.]